MLLTVPLLYAREFKPLTPEMTCQICFDRPESNGLLNILPSEIILDNWQKILTLTGGQAACIYLFPGKYTVMVKLLKLNADKEQVKYFYSPKYSIHIQDGESIIYEIVPDYYAPVRLRKIDQ